jgi:hypothetical protein
VSRLAVASRQHPVQLVQKDPCPPKGKLLDIEALYLTTGTAEVQNMCNFTSTPPLCLYGIMSGHMDNFYINPLTLKNLGLILMEDQRPKCFICPLCLIY